MPRVQIFRSVSVWCAEEHPGIPGGYQVTKTPESIGIWIRGEEGSLPAGIYKLEELIDNDGTIWWVFPGTSWGAYSSTWNTYQEEGRCSFLEELGICFGHYVQQYLGRGIYEDIGRNRHLELSLDGLRIVESTVYFPKGSITKGFEVLSTRTIGYLPINATVEDSDTGREADKRIILEN